MELSMLGIICSISEAASRFDIGLLSRGERIVHSPELHTKRIFISSENVCIQSICQETKIVTDMRSDTIVRCIGDP